MSRVTPLAPEPPSTPGEAVPDGTAVVYCEGAFGTPGGKTAHGLVRQTRRYVVVAVLDSRHAGRDAGDVLDGKASGIPIVGDLEQAFAAAKARGEMLTHLVIGIAPDGGRLPAAARADVAAAIRRGLNVDSGLHDYLSEDPELSALAAEAGVTLRDVRRPKPAAELHFFSGKIAEVDSVIVAVLGTDSAVGKRTTALILERGLNALGWQAVMIGTGQTAWLQGVRHGIILDSIVNDFVAGEIEHVIHTAWAAERPDVILLEGQGSLLNPAYPGGFELLAAGRPRAVVLQHAPARTDHDGFPGFPIGPLAKHIRLIEEISGRPVIAVTLNHEGLAPGEIAPTARRLESEVGRPVVDVLLEGPDRVIAELLRWFPELKPHAGERGEEAVAGGAVG
jgi:uncharacterized NAD-dependent epimerase/dehydratase family protein